MRVPPLARSVASRLPFYYGWVILACVCLAGFARQGPAVAVLSIFIEPMRRDLGWSSTVFGAAVAIGGVLAAFVAPAIGRMLDRHGARSVLVFAITGSGLAIVVLSLIDALPLFFVFFCFARMNWAGPFELGLFGAINHWFIARRARAASIATVAQLAGLVTFPLIAHFAIAAGGWRTGWLVIGGCVLIIGLPGVWLLLVRRPEDIGLAGDIAATSNERAPAEPLFTRAQALRTRAFWLLALFSVLVFPCQAGVSLYQASHMLERGLAATAVASLVSMSALTSAVASFAVGALPARLPMRYTLAACSASMCAGILLMLAMRSVTEAAFGVIAFGLGLGGIFTLLPVVWADYFGRASYGAIRGTALSMQVLAQACGPLLAGALRDSYGDYTRSLAIFAVLSGGAVLVALATQRPRPR